MQNDSIYTQLIDAIKSQTPCILASVVHTQNSTSATVGDKAIINANGEISGWIGGGCCQSVVRNLAPQLLKTNQHSMIRICPENEFVDGMSCYPSHCPSEGTVDLFLEPIANQPIVRLYGNTPIAQSIARYSEELSINLQWVVQWKEEQQQRPSFEKQIQSQHIRIAIIATQGQGDLSALQQALADNAEYILLIASHKKASVLKEKLQKMGICPTDIERITAPAGLDIGAITSAEIALSVMANVVSLKRQNTSSNDINNALSSTQKSATTTIPKTAAAVTTVPTPAIPTTNASSSCCGGQS